MSGNLCRCGAYAHIVAAVHRAAGRRRVRPFALRARRPTSQAPSPAVAERPDAGYLAGGTNLVDLMKLGVERPDAARRRQPAAAGRGRGDRRGRAADRRRRAATATSPPTRACARATRCCPRRCWPAASGQLRNMATTGGNLLQRTRCIYFQDVTKPCNKREPGTGCPALRGRAPRPRGARRTPSTASRPTPPTWRSRWPRWTRVVQLRGPDGRAPCPVADFHRLPGDTPGAGHRSCRHGDADHRRRRCPPLPSRARSRYRKARDRASYAFALVSVAAALDVADGDGARRAARLRRRRAPAVAGLAPPRRLLRGGPATAEAFRAAAARPSWPRPGRSPDRRRQRLQGPAAHRRPSPARSLELAGRARRWTQDAAPAPRHGRAARPPRGPRQGHRRAPRYAFETRCRRAAYAWPVQARRARAGRPASTPTRCSRCPASLAVLTPRERAAARRRRRRRARRAAGRRVALPRAGRRAGRRRDASRRPARPRDALRVDVRRSGRTTSS